MEEDDSNTLKVSKVSDQQGDKVQHILIIDKCSVQLL